MATQSLQTIPGQKTAKIARAFDYLTLVPIILVLTGAFHLSMILTVGDWDFWIDWKDRQWWPLVTPLMAITFPAAVQYVLWTHFRLPMGATVCAVVLLIGMCITRWFAYHLWTNYPINIVLPATLIPSALILDFILLLTRSYLATAVLGAMLFAAVFYPANWPIIAPFHEAVAHHGDTMTIADLLGYQYVRPGVPEYLRIIERGVLRTYGTYATPLTAFCAAVLAMPLYGLWLYIGKLFSSVRFLNRI